jgi:hypothetical protein
MIRLFVLALMAMALPAVAVATDNNVPAVNASSVSVNEDPQQSLCDEWRAVKHNGDDAAYQPGVDVNGQPVAPADLAGSAPEGFDTPWPVEIPITIDLAQRLEPDTAWDGEGVVGLAVIDAAGRVTFNGRDIGDAVVRVCGAE